LEIFCFEYSGRFFVPPLPCSPTTTLGEGLAIEVSKALIKVLKALIKSENRFQKFGFGDSFLRYFYNIAF